MSATKNQPPKNRPQRGYSEYCQWLLSFLECHYERDDQGGYRVNHDHRAEIVGLFPACGKDSLPDQQTPAWSAWMAWKEIKDQTKARKLSSDDLYISKVALGYIRKAGERDELTPVSSEDYAYLEELRRELSLSENLLGSSLHSAKLVKRDPFNVQNIQRLLLNEIEDPDPPHTRPVISRDGCGKCGMLKNLSAIEELVPKIKHVVLPELQEQIAQVVSDLRRISSDPDLEHCRVFGIKDGKMARIPYPGCPKSRRKKDQLSKSIKSWICRYEEGHKASLCYSSFEKWFFYEVGVREEIENETGDGGESSLAEHRPSKRRGKRKEIRKWDDQKVVDAWEQCNATDFATGANLLEGRFPGITANYIELAKGRIKAQKRREKQRIDRGT